MDVRFNPLSLSRTPVVLGIGPAFACSLIVKGDSHASRGIEAPRRFRAAAFRARN